MKIITTALLAATLSAALSAQTYSVTKLVSSVSGGATLTAPNLINHWGLAASGENPWWVSDNNSGLSTLYNGEGQIQSLVVTIPPGKAGGSIGAPSGIVANSTTDFGGNFFLFDTEDGTIQGWNGAPSSTIIVDNGAAAVYKGLCLPAGLNALYAANFFSGKVEAYNTNFELQTLAPDAFFDPDIPAGYAPFNIQAIGTTLFVTFAKQDASKQNEVDGPGLGYVDAFAENGKLLMRLQHGNYMNAPWGIALAGSDFGTLSGDLLVGNFGSGEVIAFDFATGKVIGSLQGSNNKPIVIPGLWALAFGQGGNNGPTDWLYFTAGVKKETGGLFGFYAPE